MPKKHTPKKSKLPFWKKLGPELESIARHIGKMADNMKLNDWFDVAIMGGLAYVGYDLTKHWTGALIGPIGYKLATTEGGTPPISQVAGLSVLAGMGLASLSPPGEYPVSINILGVEFPIREIQLTRRPIAFPLP